MVDNKEVLFDNILDNVWVVVSTFLVFVALYVAIATLVNNYSVWFDFYFVTVDWLSM